MKIKTQRQQVKDKVNVVSKPGSQIESEEYRRVAITPTFRPFNQTLNYLFHETHIRQCGFTTICIPT